MPSTRSGVGRGGHGRVDERHVLDGDAGGAAGRSIGACVDLGLAPEVDDGAHAARGHEVLDVVGVAVGERVAAEDATGADGAAGRDVPAEVAEVHVARGRCGRLVGHRETAVSDPHVARVVPRSGARSCGARPTPDTRFARMELRIGVVHTPKELTLELDGTADEIVGTIDKALAEGTAIVWVTDTKGRRVGIPAERIAYIEVDEDDGRQARRLRPLADASARCRGLLDRRLLFFTGKGGVGKSTVTAATALLAADQGKRVLLVEVDAKDNLTALFEHAPVGFEPAPGASRASSRCRWTPRRRCASTSRCRRGCRCSGASARWRARSTSSPPPRRA